MVWGYRFYRYEDATGKPVQEAPQRWNYEARLLTLETTATALWREASRYVDYCSEQGQQIALAGHAFVRKGRRFYKALSPRAHSSAGAPRGVPLFDAKRKGALPELPPISLNVLRYRFFDTLTARVGKLTLLVHRLTNDRDREVVERDCGEIDRSAATSLPNLKQGEVAMVGVDILIPVTNQRSMQAGENYCFFHNLT